MRLLIAILTAALTAVAAHAGPRSITFDELPDPAAQIFEDPFREMGVETLRALATVARLEARLATDDLPAEDRLRLEARLVATRDDLTSDGHDIERLLSKRWVVAEKRRLAAVATNPGLAGEVVRLAGYLIPAGADATGRRIGYLVPEVGMCSHMPPPPPNRLVRVSLPASLPITSVYQPVVIVGTLHAGRHDTSMYLIDGQVRMLSAWILETRQVAAVDRQTGVAAETPWQRRLRSAIGADRDRPASVPAVAAGRPGGGAGSAPDMASQSGTSAGQ